MQQPRNRLNATTTIKKNSKDTLVTAAHIPTVEQFVLAPKKLHAVELVVESVAGTREDIDLVGSVKRADKVSLYSKPV